MGAVGAVIRAERLGRRKRQERQKRTNDSYGLGTTGRSLRRRKESVRAGIAAHNLLGQVQLSARAVGELEAVGLLTRSAGRQKNLQSIL